MPKCMYLRKKKHRGKKKILLLILVLSRINNLIKKDNLQSYPVLQAAYSALFYVI